MKEDSDSNASCGCGGCVMFIVFILMFWAMFFGLPINEKKWNIDIFPPRIWDMNARPEVDVVKEQPPAEVEAIPESPDHVGGASW